MSAVLKSLGQSLSSFPVSFWIGYGVTVAGLGVLWFVLTDHTLGDDRLVTGITVCAVLCVIAPLGGIVAQALHSLVRAIYQRQLAWWHYALLFALVLALALTACYGYRHAAEGTGDWWIW